MNMCNMVLDLLITVEVGYQKYCMSKNILSFWFWSLVWFYKQNNNNQNDLTIMVHNKLLFSFYSKKILIPTLTIDLLTFNC